MVLLTSWNIQKEISRWTECGFTHPVLHWQNNGVFPEVWSSCLTAVYYEGLNLSWVWHENLLSHINGPSCFNQEQYWIMHSNSKAIEEDINNDNANCPRKCKATFCLVYFFWQQICSLKTLLEPPKNNVYLLGRVQKHN